MSFFYFLLIDSLKYKFYLNNMNITKKLFFQLRKVNLIIFLTIIIFSLSSCVSYNETFSIRTRVSKNPGLNDGLVPQGLTWNEDEEAFYTTGYMDDDSPSRIYRIDKKTNIINYYNLKKKGKYFHGHTGGLQYSQGKFYLANESDGIYIFSIDSEKKQNYIEIGDRISVNNNSSFIFADKDFIYVGEFHNGEKYKCYHDFSYNDITNKAIVSKYRKGNYTSPVAIYSIGDKIQGFAILPDGTIVLSQSYGFKPSKFLIYKKEQQIMTGQYMYGLEVCFLGEPTRVLTAPPRSEDLDIYNNQVIYMSESASKKYVISSLFFERYIYSLDIE